MTFDNGIIGSGDIHRGDIWWCDLGEYHDHVQGGMRPVIIASNDMNNLYSTTVTVIPVTSSTTKKPLPTHFPVDNPAIRENTVALCEQLVTVSKSQLNNFVCRLTLSQMRDINECIRVALGM